MSETPYVETEALIAVMNGDVPEAKRILGDSNYGELDTLAARAYRLYQLADDMATRMAIEAGRGKANG